MENVGNIFFLGGRDILMLKSYLHSKIVSSFHISLKFISGGVPWI